MAARGADASERSTGIRTSPLYPGKNKVVAQVADPTQYVRTDASNPQEMRRADAADALKVARDGVIKTDLRTPAQIATDKALQEPTSFTNTINNLGQGGSGGGSGFNINQAKLNEDKRQFNITSGLNQAQFDFSKAQTAQERADAKARYDALQAYYNSGEYGSGSDALDQILQDQYNSGSSDVQGIYNRAQENLGAGYDMAKGLTDQGYAALQNYLQQNPNNAYAGLQQQVQTVANPMEQFLSAYGVSGEPVQAQVGAEQLAGQQGAGAFNSLADILNRTAQQSDASRMAEMQMGQTMANSGLGAQRANYQAQNSNAQAQAMAALMQQLNQGKFGVEQSRQAAREAARLAALNATGNYGVNVPVVPNVPPNAPGGGNGMQY
jgi:hypothetical protein